MMVVVLITAFPAVSRKAVYLRERCWNAEGGAKVSLQLFKWNIIINK